jgi:hypothetical protein
VILLSFFCFRIISKGKIVVKQSNLDVSISKTVMILNLAGKLKRKPSGGERARFLEEESEPRNKLVFLAGEKTAG